MALQKRNGKWLARVFRGYEPVPDGPPKRLEHTRTFEKKKDAERWLREQQTLVQDKQWLPPSAMTVGQYLDQWETTTLKLGDASERTQESYRELLRLYVRPHIGMVKLTALTRAHVRRLATTLLAQPVTSGGKMVTPKEGEPVQTLAPVTVRRALAALSIALNAAVSDRLVTENSAARVPVGRVVRKPVRWLTREQGAALVAGTADDCHGALWHLLAGSGMRPGEALALTWESVDLEAGVVRVTQSIGRKKKDERGRAWRLGEPKTAGSRRAVPVDALVVEALLRHRDRQTAERLVAGDRYRAHEGGGFVFANELGGPLRQDALLQVLRRTLKRLGLPPVTMYELRHSHATWLLEGGAPLKVVSERLGHSSIVVTADTYSHVSPQFQRQAVELFAAYMRAAAP